MNSTVQSYFIPSHVGGLLKKKDGGLLKKKTIFVQYGFSQVCRHGEAFGLVSNSLLLHEW